MQTRKVISTVTTPAASYNLIDLSSVKDELGISCSDMSDDAWILRAIGQASKAIQNYCCQPIVAETLTETIYPPQADARWQVSGRVDGLQLKRWPVIALSVASTTDQSGNVTTLVPDTDFVLEPDTGLLTYLDETTEYPVRWPACMTTIVYQAGYAATPPDIEEVLLRVITGRYRARGRDPYLKIDETGGPASRRREWWVPGPTTMRGSLPDEIASVLDPYRVPPIA